MSRLFDVVIGAWLLALTFSLAALLTQLKKFAKAFVEEVPAATKRVEDIELRLEVLEHKVRVGKHGS